MPGQAQRTITSLNMGHSVIADIFNLFIIIIIIHYYYYYCLFTYLLTKHKQRNMFLCVITELSI